MWITQITNKLDLISIWPKWKKKKRKKGIQIKLNLFKKTINA